MAVHHPKKANILQFSSFLDYSQWNEMFNPDVLDYFYCVRRVVSCPNMALNMLKNGQNI